MRTLLGFGILLLAVGIFACNGSIFSKKYTFNKDIAPLIHENCSPCHRQGGVGPFPLLTYSDVKKKLKTIVRVTHNRSMPPWPADPNYSHFVGERYLSDEQIAMIETWKNQGAKEGNAADLKPFIAPTYLSSIGKPDMVLYLDSVSLFPDRKDRFFLIKIPGQLPHDTFVRAVEFVAGTPDLVHHFNGHLLLYANGAKGNVFKGDLKTEITQGEYDADFGKLDLLNDDGSKPYRIHSAVNYLPGVLGTAYPNGIGTFRMSNTFAFVGNDMHYGPSDRNVVDRSRINLFFSAMPPSRELSEIMLGTNGISKIEPPLQIAANTVSTHTTRYKVPEDISILTINPHLHMLGKKLIAFAIKPNGDTINLISIPKWDFRWQYFYTFKNMVPVPKGSEIIVTAVFDNTRSNPNNPFDPPRKIGERLEYDGASMRATDEMFQFIITYTAYKTGDEQVSLETVH